MECCYFWVSPQNLIAYSVYVSACAVCSLHIKNVAYAYVSSIKFHFGYSSFLFLICSPDDTPWDGGETFFCLENFPFCFSFCCELVILDMSLYIVIISESCDYRNAFTSQKDLS